MQVDGQVHVVGDAIDTDQILPGKYLHLDDKEEFGDHVFEGYDPSLADRITEGDIVVAGENLGLGSSREAAPLAIKHAGISAVVAESFARIFYRNCINVGLPLAQVPDITDHVEDGDSLSVDLTRGTVAVEDTDQTFKCETLPPNLQEILDAGGLIEYRRQRRE